MNVREEFRLSAAAAATALCLDFASGRALSFFYAQMGGASWIGILVAGLLFGTLNCALVHQVRRTGAQRPRDLLERFGSSAMGGFAAFLYHVVLAVAMCMLAVQAGHAGMLALPLQNAALWAMVLALLPAAAIALSGSAAIRGAGALAAACILIFELALLMNLKRMDTGALHYAVVLRLRGSYIAAIGFAVLHTCTGFCISAGLCISQASGQTRAACVGVLSGGIYSLLLALGNAVLQLGGEEILALEQPFAALAGGLGSGGFFACIALVFLSSVLGMAAVLRALMLEFLCGK